MRIEKIANLTEEELSTVVTAGKILGDLNKNSNMYDNIADNVKDLIEALKDVSAELLKHCETAEQTENN